MNDTDRPLLEQLADALQVAAPLAQRLAVTSQQQQVEARACLLAIEKAVGLLRAHLERDKGTAL
jgi:hypothetical protein